MSFADYLDNLLAFRPPRPPRLKKLSDRKIRPKKAKKKVVKKRQKPQRPKLPKTPSIRKSPVDLTVHYHTYHRLARIEPYAALPCPSPFPLSQTSLTSYHRGALHRFLSQVAVCSHGWTCMKCCHIYEGRLNIKDRGDAEILVDQHMMPFMQFLFELYFDKWSLIDSPYLQRKCGNARCSNVHHLTLTRFNSGDPYDLIHFYREKCVHGAECVLCCWEWRGAIRNDDVFATVPVIAFGTRVIFLRSFLYEKFTKTLVPRMPSYYVEATCRNGRCVNENHLRLTKRVYLSKKKVASL